MSKVTIKFWCQSSGKYIFLDGVLRVSENGKVSEVFDVPSLGDFGSKEEIFRADIEPHFYKDGERIA